MQPEKGICKCHDVENWIVNRTHWLCERGNRARLDAQRTTPKKNPKFIERRRFSKTFEYPTKWGFTKETEMYTDIWLNSPHYSYISELPIYTMHPKNNAHILPKALNKYPKYRLNPENVVLLTEEEHHVFDNGDITDREKYKRKYPQTNWDKLFKLRDRLKAEYNKTYPSS